MTMRQDEAHFGHCCDEASREQEYRSSSSHDGRRVVISEES